jgi:hypothetical protein
MYIMDGVLMSRLAGWSGLVGQFLAMTAMLRVQTWRQKMMRSICRMVMAADPEL